MIEEEYRNLSTFKEECQNRYTSMALELKTTIQEYSDWIDTTYSQETRDMKEIEKLEKENTMTSLVLSVRKKQKLLEEKTLKDS